MFFLKRERCILPNYFMDFFLLCKIVKEGKVKERKEIQFCAQRGNAMLAQSLTASAITVEDLSDRQWHTQMHSAIISSNKCF